MDNPNPIYYRDLVTPDNSITDLISQLQELIGYYEALKGKIQGAASDMAKGMKNVTAATEENRKQIELSYEESNKLVAQYRDVTTNQWKATQAFEEAAKAKKESAQIDKLITQINTSLEGSYNRLSAQYRLNKIRLNEMSEAERQGTEAGRKLEAETKAIYEQMNNLQKATGKAQLQVGHYERGLLSVIGINGKFADVVTDSAKRTETFHGIIGALKTPLGAIIGIVGTGVAAFKLWKEAVSETQASSDELSFSIAALKAVWDRFAKSIATMDFTGFIRGAAESAAAGRNLAMVLDEVFERTNSIKLLKSALSVENAALEEAAKNTALSYDERLAAAQKYLDNITPIYEQEIETSKRVRDAQLESLFALTNQRQFASDTERERAKEEFAANIQNYNLNEMLFKQANEYNAAIQRRENLYNKVQVASKEVNQSLENQRAILDAQIASTEESVKSFAAFTKQYNLTNDAQVKAYVDAQVAYNEAQAAMYNENKRIVTLRNNIEAQQLKEAQEAAKARAEAAEAQAKAEQKAAEEKANADRMAAEEAKKAAQEQINAQNALLQAQLQSINLQIAVTREGSQEMLQLRLDAINKQREIELFQNKQKADELRQSELAINKKYDKEILRTEIDFRTEMAMESLAIQQDLAASEFELLDRNERQKTQFRLQMEKERLQKILELNRVNGKELTIEQQQTIQNTIKAIDKERKKLPYDNLYELMGISLDSYQQDALNTVIDSTLDGIYSLMDAWMEEADAAVNAANSRIEAAQNALNAEIEARNNGYANNVVQAQKDLELEKQKQQKALAEREKIQKAQLALDTITQASSLITAAANIWSSLSPLGAPGIAAAIAGIATMFGSFALAKVKAIQAVGQTETYGEGTVELLQGGSHASGHDIDMGTKSDGTRRRAEGGEYFAIINKRNSRRFGDIIPDVINSFNDGTFADKYQRANENMAGLAVTMVGGSGTDVTALEKDVRKIREQGARSRFVDGDGNIVEIYKNLKQTILKS